jgi:hypothetical protein
MADASDLENPADYSDLRDEVLESRAKLAALRERVAELVECVRCSTEYRQGNPAFEHAVAKAVLSGGT